MKVNKEVVTKVKKQSVMMQEFKAFIMRGNVLDMAVGIIIGAAFGAIITSLVKDIIMPPIGLALGNVDFANLYVVIKDPTVAGNYSTPAAVQAAGGVTINYGNFINYVITFLIVAFAVFMLIRTINKMRRPKNVTPGAPTTKECPFCMSVIPIKANRCGHCTSQLEQK
jgi:large conductance mechanosensitive channel